MNSVYIAKTYKNLKIYNPAVDMTVSLEADLLTKSLIGFNAPAVSSDWIKHIEFKIPASFWRKPQKGTGDSSKISPNSN